VTAYAGVEDLKLALHKQRATPEEEVVMQRCLDAAAAEIDAFLDRVDPLPDPAPAEVTETNISRAVEWFKASDAAYGMVGFQDIGVLKAPVDGFNRHAADIGHLKQQWGVA